MDFEDIWQGIGIVLVLTGAILVGKVITAEKRVDGYYLSRGQQGETATCVYSHWTWHPDEKAFCTNDYEAALKFVERANATVKQ